MIPRALLRTLLLAAPLGLVLLALQPPSAPDEPPTSLASVYAQLRGILWEYHNLSQVSSDESIVPTRGADWYDGGRWIRLHQHTWDPSSIDINGAWTVAYEGIGRANTFLAALDALPDGTLPDAATRAAEARVLRAFYYFLLLDLYGGVPLVTEPEVDPSNPPARSSRAETFDFVEQELQAARADLPAAWDQPDDYGRVTQAVADALLARLYLNAEVFTGEVSVGGLQLGTPRWQDAIDACDRILASGVHALETDWFASFAVGPRRRNSASP